MMSNLSDLGYSDISEDMQTVEQIINYLQQQRAIAINTRSGSANVDMRASI